VVSAVWAVLAVGAVSAVSAVSVPWALLAVSAVSQSPANRVAADGVHSPAMTAHAAAQPLRAGRRVHLAAIIAITS
jgi:hypothetical protein